MRHRTWADLSALSTGCYQAIGNTTRVERLEYNIYSNAKPRHIAKFGLMQD